VDDLDLPTYVHSVLSRAGIERVSDLLARTTKELLAVPGLGQKSLEEVRSRLADRSWALSGDESDMGDDVLLGGEDDEPETALLGTDYLGGEAPTSEE
jgi:DNA-directed RNA polymerase alpha subunit